MVVTCRVPGEEIDELLHFESRESRHIVVWRQGLFYQLSIYDDKNQLLSVTVLEQFFQDIIDDADKHKGKGLFQCILNVPRTSDELSHFTQIFQAAQYL